jgi:hypothetical protein
MILPTADIHSSLTFNTLGQTHWRTSSFKDEVAKVASLGQMVCWLAPMFPCRSLEETYQPTRLCLPGASLLRDSGHSFSVQ